MGELIGVHVRWMDSKGLFLHRIFSEPTGIKMLTEKNQTIRNLVRINFTPDSELGGEPFKVPAIYKFSQI